MAVLLLKKSLSSSKSIAQEKDLDQFEQKKESLTLGQAAGITVHGDDSGDGLDVEEEVFCLLFRQVCSKREAAPYRKEPQSSR